MITNKILIIIPLLFIAFLVFSKRIELWSTRYALKIFLLMTFVTFMLSLTIFPIPVDKDLIQSELAKGINNHPFNNFELFESIKRFYYYSPTPLYFFKQVIGNILLFVPLGFLLPSIQKRYNKVWKILIISFGISVLIESIQYSISVSIGYVVRVADIDDVFLNTIGGILGFYFYQLWTRFQKILWL